MTNPNENKALPSSDTKWMQSIAWPFLCDTRALNSNVLIALNGIGAIQANPTECTKRECQQRMDYAVTYHNVVIRYYVSDMLLLVDSDAAYQVLPKAKSGIAGYFYLSDHPSKSNLPMLNAPMLVICKIIRHVVSSAEEAETWGVFTNAQLALPTRHALEAGLDYPQSPSPFKSDNSTTTCFSITTCTKEDLNLGMCDVTGSEINKHNN